MKGRVQRSLLSLVWIWTLLSTLAGPVRGQALPPPVVNSTFPSATTAGAAGFTLRVFGSNFVPGDPIEGIPGSTILWGGQPLTTTFVNATQLAAVISSSLIAQPGTVPVRVGNPDEQFSNTVPFTINPPPQITTSSPLPSGTVGVSYSLTFTVFGGTSPFLWSVIEGALPPGLTLSSAGGLGGVPTTAGTFIFQVEAKDSALVTASKVFSLTINPPPLTITTSSPLPNGRVGAAYSQALAASGGRPPYTWSLYGGFIPPGLSLSSSGLISGTPTAAGTRLFTVAVTDSAQASATKNLSLTIDPPALTITTTSPLPRGMVGSAYNQNLAATGGVPPYTWSLAAGTLPPGLNLSSAGVISGTPTTTGPFAFTVAVFDSAQGGASKGLSLTIDPPALVITTATPLPRGGVGAAYSLTFGASGGTPPYNWSLAAGSLPTGLSLSSAGVLSGTPTAAATFQFEVRVVDSAEVSVTKVFSLAIDPPPLVITTPSPLPNGIVGSAYSQTLAASGGTPPYSWSRTAGTLPPGLTLGGTGQLSGAPSSGGTFSFTAQVSDSTQATAARVYDLVIVLPPVPAINFTGLGDTANPAQQPNFGLSLASAYPAPISGRITLTFTPDAVVPADDHAIQFSTGGRTLGFTIAANQTQAVFPAQQVAIQTGTVAGTIRLTVGLRSGDQDVTPSPAPERAIRVNRMAPAITSVSVVRTAGGFDVVVTGLSTPRQVTQATFRFTPRPGANLQTTELNVAVDTVFTNWYRSEPSGQFGSSFTYMQPFTVQGDSAAISSVSVTLTNSQGASQPASANF